MIWFAAYLFFGGLVGFLAGLIGIGGGMTLVPVLSALFAAQGLAPEHSVHLALGTAMASVMFTSLSSVRAHHRLGSIDWKVVGRMVPGMLFGSFVATLATGWISQRALAILFAVIATGGATQLLLGASPRAGSTLPGPWKLAAWTVPIGAICGLMSAGGAFLTVPLMSWFGVPVRTAIGNGAAIAWPLAVIGTVGYVISGQGVESLPPHSLGFVLLPVLACLVVTSVICAPYGARMMHRVKVVTLRRGFAVMLYGMALKMVFAYW